MATAKQPTQATLLLNTSLFRPGDRVGVAVSGGADSVALLLAMHAANRAERNALGVGLSVVHVHHGIRGTGADADEAFVLALAEKLDLPLHLHHADVPARAAAERETLEEAARHVRYGYFRQLIQRGELDTIATAHTLDDQAETVLMKLLRGAWTEGLSGIHPVVRIPAEAGGRAGKIVRPLLAVRRAEIEAYLKAQAQGWCEDATNLDVTYTRNRVRHELLPLLRGYNPNLDALLAHMAELARDEEAHWQMELARLLPQVLLPGKPVRGGGRAVSTHPEQASVAIELERLRAMGPALRRRVLRAAAERLGCQLSFEHTARLLALCGLPGDVMPGEPAIQPRAGSRLDLPDGLRAERTARELQLYLIDIK
ncbi:MAG: tRNA lysidine(34) synthetase TilS [Acidobacteriaceae bacterium]